MMANKVTFDMTHCQLSMSGPFCSWGVPALKPIGCYAGNKVWYTTMGAKDIIGHAISASAGSLPSKIRVGLSP